MGHQDGVGIAPRRIQGPDRELSACVAPQHHRLGWESISLPPGAQLVQRAPGENTYHIFAIIGRTAHIVDGLGGHGCQVGYELDSFVSQSLASQGALGVAGAHNRGSHATQRDAPFGHRDGRGAGPYLGVKAENYGHIND